MKTSRLFKHFLTVVLMLVSLTAMADDFVGAAPESGQSYYIYNVGTGLYLTEGDNWGTHASVSEIGTDVKLVANSTGFNIKTHFGSKNLSWADNGLWMDQSTATQWNFTLVEGTTDRYHIQREGLTTYLQCTAGQTKVKLATMPSNAELAQWVLITLDDIKENVKTATYASPLDATSYFPNPCFYVSYNDAFAWTSGTNFGGYRADATGINGGNYMAYGKDKKFNYYISVSSMPKGIYKVVAQGCNYSPDDDTTLDAEFYVGSNSYVMMPDVHTGTVKTGNLESIGKAIAKDYDTYAIAEQMLANNSSTLKIGFRNNYAKQGHLTVIDNIRIYYYGGTIEDYQAFMEDLKAEIATLQAARITPEAAADIQEALDNLAAADLTTVSKYSIQANRLVKVISAAKRSAMRLEKLQTTLDISKELTAGASGKGVEALQTVEAEAQTVYDNKTDATDAQVRTATDDLLAAITVYNAGIAKFNALKAKINEANNVSADETDPGYAEFMAAIDKAQDVYDNPESVGEDAEKATEELNDAIVTFRLANATGTAPTVKTDPRFARGGTMAFFRMTVSGSSIAERGICYATHPNPTYDDNRSTATVGGDASIYKVTGLTPGTIYYMRAYARTSGYAVGYGDVLKVITIPKGNVGYTLNSGWPDVDTENRMKAACVQSAQLWNDLTSINGYHSTVNYGSGTPTADCSYGGWVRVGPNASYQRTGTLLHEWLHGVGVGTHGMWWNGNLRRNGDRGDWLGERANEVLRFWDNNPTAVLTGDNTHMWPYGVNGAHEDGGSEKLYAGLSLILQGLCEDGLIPTGGFCLPAYTLPVDNDDTKYYIKSESVAHGLYNSYLFVESDGSLKWKQATPATVTDDAAWTITYTPDNAYYQFKNVATGRYLTYSNSKFTTAERTTVTSADNFHVMKGRVDVADVDGLRGYWIIHNAKNSYPPTMTAASNGGVTNTNFDISNDAVTQRWIISTIEESGEMDKGFVKLAMEDLDKMIAVTKTLLATPHIENEEGLDALITSELADVEVAKAACATPADVLLLTQRVKNAALTFIGLATPTDEAQPFDLTFLLENPGMDGAGGWTYNACPDATTNYSCGEFYQVAFDMTQTVTDLPRGTYKFCAQAFQRPGTTADSYTKYTDGNPGVTAYLYADAKQQYIQQICDGKSSVKLGGTESSVGSDYVPNNMEAASKYFAKGLYENEVTTELTADKNNLKVGIKCVNSSSSYWSIFDNFRLYSLGGKATSDETSIGEVTNTANIVRTECFSLNGTQLVAPQKGVNILRTTYSDGRVEVRKVMVR